MKIFVASPVEVYHDHEADVRLADVNDSRFETDRGVLSVDKERWQQAQQYERDTWLTYNLEARADRNAEHTAGFGGYDDLPLSLGNLIEIGCGPFTNTLRVLPWHSVRSITLLDPLVEDYEREHPHCTYKDWMLNGVKVYHIATSAESYAAIPLPEKFDTVIMANVLPHCQDAMAVFVTILRIIKPKGYLVFHECARIAPTSDLYDVGHPIAPVQSVIDEFLDNFEPVYRNGDYFIGRRK